MGAGHHSWGDQKNLWEQQSWGWRTGVERVGFPKYGALGCQPDHLNIKGNGDGVWLEDLRHQDSCIY